MKYGFIGFGKLARAIYQGLKNEPLKFAYVSKEKDFDEIQSFQTIQELAHWADVLWICVKPQDLEAVLKELRGINLAKKMIVSPVAGKTVKYIESFLGGETTIARIMPNLATAYRQSVTAYADNSETEVTEQVKADLGKLGKVVEIEERYFDLFTALFGSGPAFLLEILNVFKWKTGELGVPESKANDLIIELVRGTLSYFENDPERNIPKLIEKIASKGGTTEAGLDQFRKGRIGEQLSEVIETAKRRAEDIGH